MSPSSNVLAGRVVLVPPARVGRDVLAELLQKKGAELRSFPSLRGAEPTDPEPLEQVAGELEGFDWVVLSGDRLLRRP